MFSVLVHKSYVNARRLFRSLITRVPWLDRVVGDPLRVFTGQWEWRLAYRALPNPLPIDGLVLFHRPEDGYIISRVGLNAYEGEVRQQIREVLKPGMTIVDVGANIGLYTVWAARCIGDSGRVYAFEAAPSTSDVLRKNIAANGCKNVTVVTRAVMDKKGTTAFFIEDSSGTSGVFPSGREKSCVEVEAVSLDEYFQEQGWPDVHVIKIDVEGAEKLVLDGMRELCRRSPGLKLIVEVNVRRFDIEALMEALQACGYIRFRALELRKDLNMPRDLALLKNATSRLTVNLFCERKSA